MILLRRYYSYIILLFLCLSAIFIGTLFNRTHSAELSNTTHSVEFSKETAQNAVTASRRTAIVTAVAKASPAVVNISAIRERQTSFDEWFWGEIPATRRRSLREVGSGVVVNKNGHILTNHHVIEGANKITVTVPDGREFTAQVVGYDYLSDLALLETATATNLPEIQWGDSASLLIGEWVVAIGNPFGLSIGNAQPTVTAGIVSATQRALTVDNRYHENLIQTDASINPGNSGGALVNIHGELIGINTVLRSTSGGSQGVGFAIPVNKAKKVVQQLTEYGSVIPPSLAMEVQTITEELAKKLSTPMNSGILVSEIEKRSPIANAGIKRGDVIESISGHRIKNEEDFYALTRLLPLNQPIKCEFTRRGKKRQTEFKLKTRQWNYKPPGWGITFAQLDKAMARKYQMPGIIITHVDKESKLTDVLKRGDLIYQIDDTQIHSLEVFKIVDENIRSQYKTLLYFERDGVHQAIPVTFNRNNRRR
ncbi:MAG: trypsin-like peptidase domain-containing protein [Candidatus Poribacteria bacterium]|nr:trypsin-like peptidase domain-containing protein [Candidatus Poribacteria bacterium]